MDEDARLAYGSSGRTGLSARMGSRQKLPILPTV